MSNSVILKPFSSLVTVALVTVLTSPVNAQGNSYPIACQTMVTLNQGATLTYRLTGSLPVAPGATIPPDRAQTALNLTVQWQDRNGNIHTLLNNSALMDGQQLAPDANYAQIPFEASFRGQPNNGDRLYSTTASIHGLYVSLRPTNGQPQQIQTVHYLRPGEYVRSAVGSCQTENPELNRVVDEQLRLLQTRLDAQDWAGADTITRRLLAPESTPSPPLASVLLLPERIRTIDQMWLRASNGRFGLSVQLRLWQQARAAHPRDREAAIHAFRDRVGWRLTTPRAEEDFISSDWLNESELSYSLAAPEGHLPWVGVSDQVVRSVAIPPPGVHCGVCTVDAMQLRHERFYQYIPQLMERLEPLF